MLRSVSVSLIFMVVLILSGCPGDSNNPSMDLSGWPGDDIMAKEIKDFTPVEEKFCVGQEIDPQFAEYNEQCAAAEGKGKCVQMPNPHLGKNFYCSLCGLKGTNMVCYMIIQVQED